jgi:hypothetical protein
MSEVNLSRAEILLLRRLLYSLKFGYDKFNLTELMCSPFYASILLKSDEYVTAMSDGSHLKYFEDIKNNEEAYNGIKNILGSVDSWNEYSDNDKISLIKWLMVPYTANDENVRELLIYRNNC